MPAERKASIVTATSSCSLSKKIILSWLFWLTFDACNSEELHIVFKVVDSFVNKSFSVVHVGPCRLISFIPLIEVFTAQGFLANDERAEALSR